GRHQVDGELDAVEAQIERLGEGADDEGLADPGDPLDERVSTREEGDEDRFDGRLVADDDLRDLTPEGGEGLAEVLDGGRSHGRRHRASSRCANRRRTNGS